MKYLGTYEKNQDIATKEKVEAKLSYDATSDTVMQGGADVTEKVAKSLDMYIAPSNIGAVAYTNQELTDEQKQQARTNIGVGDATKDAKGIVQIGDNLNIANGVLSRDKDVFIATYGTTTYAEIQAALNAGKTVFCQKIYTGGSQYATLTNQTETQFEFTNAWIKENVINDYEGGGGAIIYRCQESGWSAYQQDLNNIFWIELNADIWAAQWDAMTEALAAHKIVLCRASVSYNSGFSSEYVTLRLTDEFTQNNNVNRIFYGFDLDYTTGSYTAMVVLWASKSRWQFQRVLLDQSREISSAITNRINRSTAVNTADTDYTTLMARGEKLLDATTFDAVTDWTAQLVNGAIAWRFE